VLIVLWPATVQARWVGTAEQWADLQSRDAYGDMATGSIACRVRRLAVAARTLMAGRPRQLFRRATTTTESCLRASGSMFPTMPCSTCRTSMAGAVVWYSKSWRSKVTGQEDGFYIRCFLPGELY
jgi:hypothetical protein